MRIVAFVILVFAALGAAAPAEAKRVALVIGNGQYENIASLGNPQRDAGAIADRLRALGFEVIEAFDANTFAMGRAADRFIGEAKDAELALFYFAGHGVQLFDRNFLLPREVDPRRVRGIGDLGLDLAGLMDRMRTSGAVRHLLIIDACRDNPFSFDETIAILDRLKQNRVPGADPLSAGNSSRGLAGVTLTTRSSRGQMSPAETTAGVGESMLLFAAQPGSVSYDGADQHSYLVEGLREGLAKPDRPLSELLRDVSRYVRTVTNGRQIPQLVSDWSGDIVLGRSQASGVDYQISAGNELSADDRKLAIRSASSFSVFDGDFVVRASLGVKDDFSLTDAERKRLETHGGLVYRLSITYDLDRDGRDEKVHVDWLQAGYRLVIEVDGVMAAVSNCIPNLAANVEIALRDINGDRRPEVWVGYANSTGTWGTFCILEYRGLAAISNWRRGNVEIRDAGYEAFRTLLRAPAGWGVNVGTDNSIKVCAGSNCHTNWSYRFQNGYFSLVDSTEWHTEARALPFRDEAERAANTYAAYLKASRPANAGQWQMSTRRDGRAITAETKAKFAAGLSIGYECAHNGGMMMHESLFVESGKGDGSGKPAIDEVLDHGEVIDRVPIRIADHTCRHSEMYAKDDKQMVYLEEKSAERCVAALDAGGVLTLPLVLNDKALVQVRLARGSAVSAARAACLGADPRTAAAQPVSLQPAAPADLQGRIADFISKKYLITTAATDGDLNALYMETVDFHGQAGKSRAAVVKEVGAWLKRWASLDYRLLPPSVQVKPVPGANGRYDVTFDYTFAAYRQNGTGRCGQGQTEVRLVAIGDDFRIARVRDKANGKNC